MLGEESVIQSFYEMTKRLYREVAKARSKTIAGTDFKENALQIYESWKTNIEPQLKEINFDESELSRIDCLFEKLDLVAKNRVANVNEVKDLLVDINKTLIGKILPNVTQKKPDEDLVKSAEYLGLNQNWFSSTCALQLQEVSIKLVAEKAGIDLNKANVEKILSAKIELKNFGFNNQYEAFGKEVNRLFNVDMPFLATQFRKMRVKVLHEGYNPEPEERDSLVSFTLGLMKKLDDVCKKI
jgi:CRISPR/Cas system-associated exonuclease Cas4 (RecB family)